MIGINTAIIPDANTVGFAIPIDVVSAALDDLRAGGRVARGYLGVDLEAQSADRAGAVISRVTPDTPASRAGLRARDVVVEINGARIRTNAEFYRAIGHRRPGDEVRLDIRRGGADHGVELVLGEMPDESAAAKARALGPGSR